MSDPQPGRDDAVQAAPAGPVAPDMRGVFAATLALESIVVLLALLVLTKVGNGATVLGVSVIVALAAAMIVAVGLQRRSWGLRLALALQVVMIGCGLLVPVLGVMGLVFAAVWALLLRMRREVHRRAERGELPAQQVRDT